MSWKKLVGAAVGVAATAAASAIDPSLAPIVGGALAAGAGTKEVGKRIEKRTGASVHKAGAPLAAIVGGAAGSQFVDPQMVCEAVSRACANPMLISGGIGIFMVGLHQLYLGLQRSGKR